MKKLAQLSRQSEHQNLKAILIPIISMLFLLASLSLINFGCSSPIEPGSRDICEPCKSDVDCREGLTCEVLFNSTGVARRCVSPSTTSCN